MKPKSFMLIAGEPSGDRLAAELVSALRAKVIEVESVPTDDAQPLNTPLEPQFFGAGGSHLAAVGVELAVDMTQHSVIGVSDVFKKFFEFRRLFHQLLRLAIKRQPDVIIGVDYGGFNLRFGHAIKEYVRRHRSEFTPWNPRLVQYVSPQVWASRPGRAHQIAEDYDLLLSIFPFEKDWYAARMPGLRVEFVGHPMVERLGLGATGADASLQPSKLPPSFGLQQTSAAFDRSERPKAPEDWRSPKHPREDGSETRKSEAGFTLNPNVLLLPGSRPDEVRRHWPIVTGAFELLRRKLPNLTALAVLPNEDLAQVARSFGSPTGLEVKVGGLQSALAQADLAITKSGTITLECAAYGVPAVVFYKTSWPTYWIGRQVVNVRYLAMPNLLANDELFPEFIQHTATPENIANAALDLFNDPSRVARIKSRLKEIIASLGNPGASKRAAQAIVSLLKH